MTLGLRSLACYSPWERKESDTTELLNNNKSCFVFLLVILCISHGRGKEICPPLPFSSQIPKCFLKHVIPSGLLPLPLICLLKLQLSFQEQVSALPDSRQSSSPVRFSCSVMSDSLQLQRLQHSRLPCPSPTPGVHPDSAFPLILVLEPLVTT